MSTSLVPFASKTLRPILYRSTKVLQTCVNVGRSSSSPRTSFFWRMLSATRFLRSARLRRRPRGTGARALRPSLSGTTAPVALLPVAAPCPTAARREDVLHAGRVDQAPADLLDERLPVEADLVAQEVGLVDLLEGEVDEHQEGLHHSFAAHRHRLEDGLLVLGAHLGDRLGGGGVAQVLLVPLDDARQRIDGEPAHL